MRRSSGHSAAATSEVSTTCSGKCTGQPETDQSGCGGDQCWITRWYCSDSGPAFGCPGGYTSGYNACGQNGLPPNGCQENCYKSNPGCASTC